MPELTAGMIAGEMKDRAARNLGMLLAQTAIERMEIVVVDISSSGGLAGVEHPAVRYFHRPGLGYYCQAQAMLARLAGAPIIAYIEDHSSASAEWAQEVLDAFDDPKVGAVSYTFSGTNPRSWLSQAILMAEYGHWMAPHPGGPVTIASSTNIAYRREMLLEMIDGNEEVFEAEFLLHQQIRASGKLITVAPKALVVHESWRDLRSACSANGWNKRVLGARRAAEGNWGLAMRMAAAAAAATLAAPLHLARLAWVLRRRPALWLVYSKSLPVALAIYAWSGVSEALGYLFGAGTSREEVRRTEVAVERDG